jgi:ATP-binding cassette subfamily A (ABC1) protein 3
MSNATSEENAIDAAVLELTACLEAVQTQDLAYASCIMNTGLFDLVPMPTPAKRIERETLGNRTAWFESQLSPGTALGNCRLLCSAPTTIASASCCMATAELHMCELTPANATKQLTECKRVFDRGFQFTHECGGVSVNDIGLIVATGLILAAVFAIAVSARQHFNGFNRELQKVADTSDSQQKVLEFRLARSPRWKALLTAWRQITNLVWKNLLIKQRRPVALVVEQFLPVLLSAGLVLLANLDSLFGSSDAQSSSTARTYQASTNETEVFCMNYTVSNLADLGGPNSTMAAFYASGQAVLGMFFLVTYIKFVSSTTTSMVLEKETRMREVMKIMGLSDFTLLCSWCLTSGILSTPLAFAIAAQLKFGNVFPTTELGTLVFLFWSLSLAIVAFSYFMTPFFHKSRAAALMSVLLWLVLFFPFYAVQSRTSHAIKFWAALSPPTAFGLAIDNILRYAQLGTGFAYSIGIQNNPIDVPSAFSMSWMLLLDSLLLVLAGWYLEQVLPQKFGVHKPWNFLFTRAYWVRTSSLSDDLASMHSHSSLGRSGGEVNKVTPTEKSMERSTLEPRALDSGLPLKGSNQCRPPLTQDDQKPTATPSLPPLSHTSTPSTVEPVSATLAMQEARGECLRIRGLRKVFPSSHGGSGREDKVAVAGLDLTLYNGQITALLGHNGAGKTTVISMLTGLIPPSAGNATIFGRSIRGDMDQLRRIIGICPQHDVLFNNLTVFEHLQFFGTMKLVPPQHLDQQANKLLDDVGLADARLSLARTLSGGQKRKLSVAIAFIGDSKLVFLDEPTSGMDPYSRRFTWNLLQKSRANRVIVLTTHFMDEADILGDRIAIVSDGRLHCSGTSLFLKARFGAGYNLTAIKTRTGDPKAIAAFLQRFVPEASCVSDYGSELVFQLPTAAAAAASGSPTAALPNMLEALEENMQALGIEQYGISVTTLEQVFLRIAREREGDSASVTTIKQGTNEAITKMATLASPKTEQSMSSPSFIQQLVALTIKRVQIARRDRRTLVNSVAVRQDFRDGKSRFPTREERSPSTTP